MKEIIHEFHQLPNIFGGLIPRGKFNIPPVIVPDTFSKAQLTDNIMDNLLDPFVELKQVLGCTGLHLFDEDICHSIFYLN